MDHTRCLKVALEQNLQARIPASHQIVKLLLEHAWHTLNRFRADYEGGSAHGRLRGMESAERMCEFGEGEVVVPAKLRG